MDLEKFKDKLEVCALACIFCMSLLAVGPNV